MKQALAKLELLKAEFQDTVTGHGAEPPPDSPRTAPGASHAGGPATAARQDSDRLVRIGLFVLLGFFGFLGGWAALSPLESAAITYGLVSADGNRKAIQHMDGGIVSAILVKEGDFVQAGQDLIQLDQLQPRAALEIQNAAVVTQSAVLARLEAESADRGAIALPPVLSERRDEPGIAQLLASQEQLFRARRTANATQIGTIREQIKQAKSQIEIYEGQAQSAADQYRMVNEELGPKQMLFDKGYATNAAVMQLKRAASALLGQQQEFTGHIARLQHLVGQLESQAAQVESDYRLKIAQELEDARNKIADARERQRVAADILARTVIRAPVSGHVLGLTVNTVGGVVGKGERLLEIVPAESGLVIKGQLRPADALEVHDGMRAEIRLMTAMGRKLPMVHGKVRNRSADARSDAENKGVFFDITVEVEPSQLAALGGVELAPGLPVEVIIPTGSRTVLEYILDPVKQSLRHGLREK
mgnify:CR=1 FL=1